MKDECLICGAPLAYLEAGKAMTCTLCGREEISRTVCEKGHYVCNECHMSGMDAIVAACLGSQSRDPGEILRGLMDMPFCHMHGPEHHVMVGAALLTAFRNAGGTIDLGAALKEMIQRGSQVPGGACGFWGACGAGVSTGIFLSIATGATPLSSEAWGQANRMTSAALSAIGAVGGPRCCKRDSFLAMREAVRFVREELGVEMTLGTLQCSYFRKNNQCLGRKCPFHP